MRTILYFPPNERKAMAKSGIVLTNEEIKLAAQVEKTLAEQGTIVKGSLQDDSIHKKNIIEKFLSHLPKS